MYLECCTLLGTDRPVCDKVYVHSPFTEGVHSVNETSKATLMYMRAYSFLHLLFYILLSCYISLYIINIPK